MMRRIFLLAVLFNLFSITSFSQDPHWEHVLFPYELNNWELSCFTDTATNENYIYGKFKSENSQEMCRYNIALYDGETFNSIGGFSNKIHSVTKYNDKIYAGGSFNCVDSSYVMQYFAVYDEGFWQPVAEINGSVLAIIADEDYLYIAGTFSEINGLPMESVARYDGENWEALGGNELGDDTWVKTLCFFQGELYIGGSLDVNNDSSVDGLRVLRNNEWTIVDDINLIGHTSIKEMVVWGGKLYLIGRFFFLNNPLHTSLIAWDGVEFSAPYPAFYDRYQNISYGSEVHRLISTPDKLYIAGSMEYIGNQQVNQLAAYDGEEWCAMYTPGLQYPIFGLFTINNVLYTYLILNPYSNSIYPTGLYKWIGENDFENCQTYTGLSEVLIKELTIFPNPARSSFTINGDFIGEIIYSIYDLQGRKIQQKTIRADGSFVIDCSGFPEGTYLLHLLNKDNFYRAKIIVL